MAEKLVFTGLLDLATTDTTDVKAVYGRLQTPGIYVVEIVEAGFTEPAEQGAENPRIGFAYNGIIHYYAPLESSGDGDYDNAYVVDPEKMLGATFRDTQTIWLRDFVRGIGLLRGMFANARLITTGAPGGVKGAPEGWIDGAVGKRVAIRVSHYTTKDGDTRQQIDWLSPKNLEKNGLAWEDLGREAYNLAGEPMDDPIAKP